MLGILLLVVAIVGIGVLSRKRGSSPFIWAAVAAIGAFVIGYLSAPLMASSFVRQMDLPNLTAYIPTLAAWGWIGLIALIGRFGVGAGGPKPAGMWTCPECKSLNAQSAIYCDACREPWSQQD